MFKVPDWYVTLFGKIPRVAKAGGENQLCIDFANELRAQKFAYSCVWFHVCNEFSGQHNPVFGAVQKAMGKVSGAPDYIFINTNLALFIEFKDGDKPLRKEQKAFKKWCEHVGVYYEMAKSKQEGLEILDRYGFICTVPNRLED